MTVPVSALQEVAPGAVIELFELELNTAQHGTNDTYRFHAGTSLNNNGEIVWNSNNYLRFPVEAEGFEYNGNGQLPRPKLRVSNILSTITAVLLTLPDGLEGAKITRIRTLARYLDAVNFPGNVNPYGTPDPTAEFPREIFYIDRKTVENRDVVEFELAAAFDLAGVRAPKRQCIPNLCQWEYRSPECSYTGNGYFDANDVPTSSAALDICGKRLTSCETRFKSFTRNGSVTSGSNLLTLAQPISVSTGTPVSGHGIPPGTTINSVSANGLTATMSQVATSNMLFTRTGTIQAGRTTMVVSSAASLAIGMLVSGTGIRPGTAISGISGTTITLSQRSDPNYVYVLSRTGRIKRIAVQRNELNAFFINSTAGVSRNMQVRGPGFPTSPPVLVTSIASVAGVWNSQPASLGYWIGTTYEGREATGTYDFYTDTTFSPATYTFSASPTYVFRNPADDQLPFGGFPGVGAFTL